MRINRDKLGLFISIICTLHCLAAPLMVIFIPFLSGLTKASWIHGLVLGFAILPAVESLIFDGYFNSKYFQIFFAILGLSLMFLGLIYSHHASEIHSDYMNLIKEHLLFLSGGILLGCTHLYKIFSNNYSDSFSCQHCKD